ncbi:MAG: sodium-dependent transporter [Paludibacteraceae bacterium]|nr:sodium-dependent transporter [Paludibacteraceae bacterium]
MQKEEKSAPSFTSKVGLVMAAVGSAVGLGNIWKFPYIAGQNGGGAFLLIYLLCVLLFGLPLLITEFTIGKHSGRSVYGAFSVIRNNNRWQWIGWLCMLATILVMGFYTVVTGWCINYLIDAISNTLYSSSDLTAHFTELSSNGPRMFGYSILALALTSVVLWFDVNKGIERLSKILMPLLLIMMIFMAIRVLMLPGSNVGMRFFFEADFSKLSPKVILDAMGQCFFSLSIGLGALITYGAYMPKHQNIIATSVQVAVLDSLVAILAGLIIFPAVFAFGVDPAEGPQLAFVVLPSVFEQMSLSSLSSIMFFGLLCIAAITSMISLMEVLVAFLTEATAQKKHSLDRHKAVLLAVVICVVTSSLCAFSLSGTPEWLKIGDKDFFTVFDTVASNFLMPLGALSMAIFIGWFMPESAIKQELRNGNRSTIHYALGFLFMQIVRYFVPIAIVAIFLNGVLSLI